MVRLLYLAALLVPATAVAGETAAPAKSATAATTSEDPDERVCRRVTTIGSNIPGKKVCVSRRDYEAAQRAAREEAEQMRSGGGHASGN